MDGHLGHVQIFVITNNTAMNISLCPTSFICLIVYMWIYGLLEQFKNFIDIAKLTYKYYTHLQSSYQYMSIPISPYPHQQWGLSNFLIIDNLT